MKRTQIQIHTDQLKWLKQQAAEKGVSMAQLVRESIALYQQQTEKSERYHLQKKNALLAVGAFSSVDKIKK